MHTGTRRKMSAKADGCPARRVGEIASPTRFKGQGEDTREWRAAYMATVKGYVEKIKFRNEENGYSVLQVGYEGKDYVLVGSFAYINEGDLIEAEGRENAHPVYGEQFQVESYELKEPEDAASMERYLASGAIKGIKAALAARIVRRFKADTFRIMEEEPDKLAQIKGISEKMAYSFSQQMEDKRDMRQAMMFLQGYGISMNLALKIYQKYGSKLYGIIKENPYRLVDDIQGVGFKIADEIAQKAGITADSDYRLRSGIFYCLLQSVAGGHTYLPQEELINNATDLLHVPLDMMEKHLMDLQMEKKIVIKMGGEQSEIRQIYAASYYYMELNAARMLHDLNIRGNEAEEKIRGRLKQIQAEEKIEPDELQIQAVIQAVNCGLLIITGGPGTGKTTTINTIIRYFEQEGMTILLAAPTGRAAKRMTEATGYEASTIHRLLELTGIPDDAGGTSSMHFERNEENPLEADAVIIDETSMVDIYLFHALLRAINPGTRLILVGDVSQLPSVGAGNVLRDIINSGYCQTVCLNRIFRQAAESDIIVNAHKINAGEQIPLGKPSRDFIFIRGEQPDAIIKAMITLVKEKLPGYVHAEPLDIQIMTPMRKGALGVERLNGILQECLNPPSSSGQEKEIGGVIYRVGDKVMQIKNNYQIEWEIRGLHGVAIESGTGVFNGDMGIIREINTFSEEMTVEFDEKRMVDYSFKQAEELELAYAITIHKSQGSEYPAVVIPVFPGPRMLMSRNLIYTAVTRAKVCVCLVGIPSVFQEMVNNEREQLRYTGLKERIQEIEEV